MSIKKVFLIFWEMEIFDPKIQNFANFFLKKSFFYISGSETF